MNNNNFDESTVQQVRSQDDHVVEEEKWNSKQFAEFPKHTRRESSNVQVSLDGERETTSNERRKGVEKFGVRDNLNGEKQFKMGKIEQEVGRKQDEEEEEEAKRDSTLSLDGVADELPSTQLRVGFLEDQLRETLEQFLQLIPSNADDCQPTTVNIRFLETLVDLSSSLVVLPSSAQSLQLSRLTCAILNCSAKLNVSLASEAEANTLELAAKANAASRFAQEKTSLIGATGDDLNELAKEIKRRDQDLLEFQGHIQLLMSTWEKEGKATRQFVQDKQNALERQTERVRTLERQLESVQMKWDTYRQHMRVRSEEYASQESRMLEELVSKEGAMMSMKRENQELKDRLSRADSQLEAERGASADLRTQNSHLVKQAEFLRLQLQEYKSMWESACDVKWKSCDQAVVDTPIGSPIASRVRETIQALGPSAPLPAPVEEGDDEFDVTQFEISLQDFDIAPEGKPPSLRDELGEVLHKHERSPSSSPRHHGPGDTGAQDFSSEEEKTETMKRIKEMLGRTFEAPVLHLDPPGASGTGPEDWDRLECSLAVETSTSTITLTAGEDRKVHSVFESRSLRYVLVPYMLDGQSAAKTNMVVLCMDRGPLWLEVGGDVERSELIDAMFQEYTRVRHGKELRVDHVEFSAIRDLREEYMQCMRCESYFPPVELTDHLLVCYEFSDAEQDTDWEGSQSEDEVVLWKKPALAKKKAARRGYGVSVVTAIAKFTHQLKRSPKRDSYKSVNI